MDLDLGLLNIRQQRVQLGYAVIEGTPKTKSGQRTVQLDADTVVVFRTHALSQEAERIVAGAAWRGDDYVFCHEDGAPLHPESVTRRFGRLVQRLDLPKIRLHDLRHTHASHGLGRPPGVPQVPERLAPFALAVRRLELALCPPRELGILGSGGTRCWSDGKEAPRARPAPTRCRYVRSGS